MSSAARDQKPRAGDDLPRLKSGSLRIHEADPLPAPGSQREQLALLADARARANEAAITGAVTGYLDRLMGVVEARLRGPRARRGTRFWEDRATKEFPDLRVETKALDPEYIVPDRTVEEIGDAVRPVAIRIVGGTVRDVGNRLGRSDVGLTIFDQTLLNQAVENLVSRMTGVARRHAAEIRAAILDANSTAEDLDAVLDRVRQAHRRGAQWLLLSGRTLATALAGDAALSAAKTLGITHTQWISKRDDRVRPTHVLADGQVRPIGTRFRVGDHLLLHPGDPSGLPASWEEVANCRCGLLFSKPDPAVTGAVKLARTGAPVIGQGLAALSGRIDRFEQIHGERPISTFDGRGLVGRATGDVHTQAGDGLPALAKLVTLRKPAVGYRVLDSALNVDPGQLIDAAGTLSLGLVAPAVAAGLLLIVVLPVGTTVGLAGGAAVLPAGTALTVLAVDDRGVVAQPVQGG